MTAASPAGTRTATTGEMERGSSASGSPSSAQGASQLQDGLVAVLVEDSLQLRRLQVQGLVPGDPLPFVQAPEPYVSNLELLTP